MRLPSRLADATATYIKRIIGCDHTDPLSCEDDVAPWAQDLEWHNWERWLHAFGDFAHAVADCWDELEPDATAAVTEIFKIHGTDLVQYLTECRALRRYGAPSYGVVYARESPSQAVVRRLLAHLTRMVGNQEAYLLYSRGADELERFASDDQAKGTEAVCSAKAPSRKDPRGEKVGGDTTGEKPDLAGGTSEPSDRKSKEAQAVALLMKHPDWSDTQIAEAVPCSRTSLYRFKLYTAARQLMKRERENMPPGYRDPRTGEVHPYSPEAAEGEDADC